MVSQIDRFEIHQDSLENLLVARRLKKLRLQRHFAPGQIIKHPAQLFRRFNFTPVEWVDENLLVLTAIFHEKMAGKSHTL